MATDLPTEPESRKEQYLAKIAGQNVTLPDRPKSREEQYLAYIAENGGGGGGGGSYTAGEGIEINGNEISTTANTAQVHTAADGQFSVFNRDGETISFLQESGGNYVIATTDIHGTVVESVLPTEAYFSTPTNLTNKYTTEELSAKVRAGDFSGLKVGDYITKTVKVGNNATQELDFVIAGFDYFFRVGDIGTTGITQHHLIMISDTSFKESLKMNSTATSEGGYLQSELRGYAKTTYTPASGGNLTGISCEYDTFSRSSLGGASGDYDFIHNGSSWTLNGQAVTAGNYGLKVTGGTARNGDKITVTYLIGNLQPYRQAIINAFGDDHILMHRTYNTVSTSSGAWMSARVELMNETMVYGSTIEAYNTLGERTCPSALPYFVQNPQKRVSSVGKGGGRNSWWLSSIHSNTQFCGINAPGLALYFAANSDSYARPYFLFY